MTDNNNKSKSGQLGAVSSKQKAPDSEKWDLSEKKKTPVPITVTAGTGTTTVPMESRENVSDKDRERTDAYVTSIEAIEVRIEPDVIRIDSSAELTTLHNVYNMGDTPVVFRVKVTTPSIFRVRPVTGQVAPKGNTAIKVTRVANAVPRSDRFDIEFMALVPEVVPREKWAPVLPNGVTDTNVVKPLGDCARNYSLFAMNYKPVVRRIRYRAAPPWSTFLTQIENRANYTLGPALEDACIQGGLHVENHSLSLAEFVILNLALGDVK